MLEQILDVKSLVPVSYRKQIFCLYIVLILSAIKQLVATVSFCCMQVFKYDFMTLESYVR